MYADAICIAPTRLGWFNFDFPALLAEASKRWTSLKLQKWNFQCSCAKSVWAHSDLHFLVCIEVFVWGKCCVYGSKLNFLPHNTVVEIQKREVKGEVSWKEKGEKRGKKNPEYLAQWQQHYWRLLFVVISYRMRESRHIYPTYLDNCTLGTFHLKLWLECKNVQS